MFSVGIIGLPNTGKSTLFKALTKIAVPISVHPFTTIDPNRGIVKVQDKRLDKIRDLSEPQITKPVLIEFLDIAGLVKDAHLGKGLGNQFLSHINEADVLIEVVRLFQNREVSHVEGTIDPRRDIDIIKKEVLAWDKKIISTFTENLEKKMKINSSDKKLKMTNEVVLKFKNRLEKNVWLSKGITDMSEEFKKEAKNLGKKIALLSVKPMIFLFNVAEDLIKEKNKEELKLSFPSSLFIDLKKEEQIADLTDEERSELNVVSLLDDLILSCYNKLNLITFYTIKGGEEIRAHEIKQGERIITAAGKIHSDFQEKFVRAEVLSFKDFIRGTSWQEAKLRGFTNTKGRDYIVNDGDIIEIKI